MVYIEGGSFEMGHDDNNRKMTDIYITTAPVHTVTLSSFYIGKYEVTQEEWETVMGSNPSWYKGHKRPVEQVDWKQCQEFIKRINSLSGKSFRLPTEAEWEFAARGGNKSQGFKYAGSNNYNDVAWTNDNSSETQSVGQKSPNELGLYDMTGNVSEWCQDWLSDYSANSQIDPVDMSTYSLSDEYSWKVMRGGSFDGDPQYMRIFDREAMMPVSKSLDVGFRLVYSQ